MAPLERMSPHRPGEFQVRHLQSKMRRKMLNCRKRHGDVFRTAMEVGNVSSRQTPQKEMRLNTNDFGKTNTECILEKESSLTDRMTIVFPMTRSKSLSTKTIWKITESAQSPRVRVAKRTTAEPHKHRQTNHHSPMERLQILGRRQWQQLPVRGAVS